MNKKINYLYLFFFIITISLPVFSQSDFEIVQSFKNQYQKIEDDIEDASSLSDLADISVKIAQLKSEFHKNKTLLDKSLYPNDFNRSIDDLTTKMEIRRADFSQIDVLQTEVVGLRQEVELLNQRNNELLNQVQSLETQVKKDRTRITQLENSIAELKTSLQKRDELVFGMVDSLLPPSFRSKDLTSEEKEQVISKAERTNIVENIKRALRDHTRFLEVTTLTPDDIEEMKEQQEQFAKVWQNVGPKLIDIYSDKGENTNNLKEIDEAFTNWHNALQREAWSSIHEEYAINNINLPRFSSGKTFADAVTSYIDDEIKTAEIKGEEEAKKTYDLFADSLWFDIVKPEWIPYLTENNMITDAQKDTIEYKISEWKSKVYPSSFNWLYIVIGLLVLIIIIMIIIRRKPSEPKPASEETT